MREGVTRGKFLEVLSTAGVAAVWGAVAQSGVAVASGDGKGGTAVESSRAAVFGEVRFWSNCINDFLTNKKNLVDTYFVCQLLRIFYNRNNQYFEAVVFKPSVTSMFTFVLVYCNCTGCTNLLWANVFLYKSNNQTKYLKYSVKVS